MLDGMRHIFGGFPVLLILLILPTTISCRPRADVQQGTVQTGPRHVLLISLDALRADHLSCYGYDRLTSPFIDSVAAGGRRYSHAYVNTHGTPPSHTTMLSSLYQESHRVGFGADTPEGRNDTVPAKVEMVQEILRAHHWSTVAVTGGGYMSRAFGFSKGFDDFSDRARSVAQGTSMLLEKIKLAMAGGRPIFALYHTYEIHSPYEPPQEYQNVFGTFDSVVSVKSKDLVALQSVAGKVLKKQDFDFLESRYDGEIRYTDDVLRHFFEELETIGFLKNALVIITADHGEEFGDHGGLLHRASLFEELVHIPLIISGSGISSGVVDPRLVSLIDITPTILDVGKLKPTEIMEGQSLLNREAVVNWQGQRVFAQYTSRLYSVRTPRWKLILKTGTHPKLLFDLRHDPAEKHNVLNHFPEIGDALEAEINTWKDGCPDLDIDVNRPHHLSKRTVDELKALGYISQ